MQNTSRQGSPVQHIPPRFIEVLVGLTEENIHPVQYGTHVKDFKNINKLLLQGKRRDETEIGRVEGLRGSYQ